MNLFLSFLFWVFSFNGDLPPSEIQSFRQSSVQRVVPLTRSTTPVRPKATPRSRAGGGTVIILEDTHFKPNL